MLVSVFVFGCYVFCGLVLGLALYRCVFVVWWFPFGFRVWHFVYGLFWVWCVMMFLGRIVSLV